MSKTIYCTYLTVYSGNKLPPFYIGSTSVDNIKRGYRGSVTSKRYKSIWKTELKLNSHLFKTKILTTHKTREQALEKEQFFHKSLDVVNSPLYVNQAIASKNGCFGVSLFGKENHMYGKRHSIQSIEKMKNNNTMHGKQFKMEPWIKEKISKTLTGKYKGPLNGMYGKTHTEKARKNISLKVSGKNNGSYGMRWFHNPKTNHNVRCFPENKPENYIPGRILV